jgi:hypothetical protein
MGGLDQIFVRLLVFLDVVVFPSVIHDMKIFSLNDQNNVGEALEFRSGLVTDVFTFSFSD